MTHEQPELQELLDQYRALLQSHPNQSPTPLQMHLRGALLWEIRETKAYEAEGITDFHAFCQLTQRELGTGCHSSAALWIKIYEGYAASQLRKCRAPQRSLLAILGTEQNLRDALLLYANHHTAPQVEQLIYDLQHAKDPLTAQGLLLSALDRVAQAERRARPRAATPGSDLAPTPTHTPAPPPPTEDPIPTDDPLYDRLDRDPLLPACATPLDLAITTYLKNHAQNLSLRREIYALWQGGQDVEKHLVVAMNQAALEDRDISERLFDALYPKARLAEAELRAQADATAHARLHHQALRDAMLTVGESTAQTSLVGVVEADVDGRSVHPLGVSVNGGETIVVIGDKRSGKSGTAQVLMEAHTDESLEEPAGVITFLYNQPGHLPPELLAALRPNQHPALVESLLNHYHLPPQGCRRVVYLAPEELLRQRRRELPKADFPNLFMRPLRLHRSELTATTLQRMLGADMSNNALYLRQLTRGFVSGEDAEALLDSIDGRMRALARARLASIEDLLWDGPPLGHCLTPGTIVVVELSGLLLPPGDVLPMISGLTDIFLRQQRDGGRDFHKLVILEEGHLYLKGTEVGKQIVTLARLCRHLLATLVVVSQDHKSIPEELISLASLLFLHRTTDHALVKALLRRVHALRNRSAHEVATLPTAQALLVAQAASHEALVREATRMRVRPPRSAMGGGTRFAK